MTSSIASILQTLRLVPPSNTAAVTTKTGHGIDGKKGQMLSTVLPEITLEAVAEHDDCTDCWVVIYDRVYDVTNFLLSHPGGEDVIMDYAGRDATLAFHGTGHSKDAIEMMRDYLIGELPQKDRIFRGVNCKILSGVPE